MPRCMPRDEDRKPYPTWVDERATENPDRVFARIPVSDALQDGYRVFTYSQLSKAVNVMSWWLDEQLGKAVDFPTLAYAGSSDLRYAILYLAALKTRRQVMFPLNQNTRQAHLNLLESTGCKTLIASQKLLPLWDTLRPEVNEFRYLTIPNFESFYAAEVVENYPFTLTWQESKHDPILIMHTSGSTGLPKPIKFTSFMLSNFTHGNTISLFSSTVLALLPPSWIVGLKLILHYPLDLGTIPTLLPGDAPFPMTPEYVDKVHTIAPTKAGVYIPSLLKELAKKKEYLDHMRHMKMISFGGAPLDKEVGDLFATFTHVQPAVGSTEVGAYGPMISPQSDSDWRYLSFDPIMGFHFLPFNEERGLYQMVIKKHEDPEKASRQMVFEVFPELELYDTKDVWQKHPSKEGLWLFSGRTDDFVKLSTMTKFNATDVESQLVRDRRIAACIMGGDGMEIPFLLIELADSSVDETQAREDLWPLIEEVNRQNSEMIKLKKERVIFTKSQRPMKRVVGKGTVSRRGTLEDYALQIQSLSQK